MKAWLFAHLVIPSFHMAFSIIFITLHMLLAHRFSGHTFLAMFPWRGTYDVVQDALFPLLEMLGFTFLMNRQMFF